MTSSTSSAIGTGSRIGALATVSIVAGKEFRDCLRSRWLVFGSALFAILGPVSYTHLTLPTKRIV